MFDPSKVRKERTEWRDLELSKRHREWGFHCPAVDIDFLMVEYYYGKPVAIIDYKRFTGSKNNTHPKSYEAISILADNSHIPFFVVYYYDNPWSFRLEPINNIAKKIFEENKKKLNKCLTEREYVEFLYWLRGHKLSQEEKRILEGLNNTLPEPCKENGDVL
jgi:hypothetical protein